MPTRCPLIRRFEFSVLKPLWLAVLATAFFHGYRREWWSVGAMVVALLLLGGVGSALHPAMSASELAQGPTSSPGARFEVPVVSDAIQLVLVSRGCTLVAAFLIPMLTWWSTQLAGLPWYFALPAALVAAPMVGGVLKYVYVLRPQRDLQAHDVT